jgi:hypothetical protein
VKRHVDKRKDQQRVTGLGFTLHVRAWCVDVPFSLLYLIHNQEEIFKG